VEPEVKPDVTEGTEAVDGVVCGFTELVVSLDIPALIVREVEEIVESVDIPEQRENSANIPLICQGKKI